MSQIKNIPIGEVLKEYGYITEAQLQQALAYQKENRGKRLGEVLIEQGYITEQQMLDALARRLNLGRVELSNLQIDVSAVAKIPQQLAEKYGILALSVDEGTITVATNDPLNFYAMEDIRQLTGMELEIRLAEKAPLARAISYYYTEVSAHKAANTANEAFQDNEMEELELEEGDGEVPIIKLLNSLVQRAYTTNASDIHIEPFEDKSLVRMRIDGTIVDYVTLQKALHASLIARIKIISGMDIAERRIPQDGHCKVKVNGTPINIRVSVIPTVFGEKAVMRLLASQAVIDHSRSYGMAPTDYEKFTRMLRSPNGIIYITGPTGSGKTTTLYMVLEELSKRQVNISTIEDPVEKNLPRINQMQVNNQAGLTFEIGLRALLRQDPDVIMVGETRDAETANISIRAAITGHLVLSTLHTTGAAQTVDRIVDACPSEAQNQVRTQLSGVLNGVITQCLVPLTGGNGRIAATEILVGTDAVLNLIRESKAHQMGTAMQSGSAFGMHTLNSELCRLVQQGTISAQSAYQFSNDRKDLEQYL